MNPKYSGDSYDLVKRFFIGLISDCGYEVFVEPRFTDHWSAEEEESYYKLIGAKPCVAGTGGKRTALLVDPDTGIKKRRSRKHVTIEYLVKHLHAYSLIAVYDQSFDRRYKTEVQMKEKMAALRDKGASCFYYDSHAKFLFASLAPATISTILRAVKAAGIPPYRLINQ